MPEFIHHHLPRSLMSRVSDLHTIFHSASLGASGRITTFDMVAASWFPSILTKLVREINIGTFGTFGRCHTPFPGHFEDICIVLIIQFGFSTTSCQDSFHTFISELSLIFQEFFQDIFQDIFFNGNSFSNPVYSVSAQGGWLGHRQYDTNPLVVDTFFVSYFSFASWKLKDWKDVFSTCAVLTAQHDALQTHATELDSIFQIWLLHAGCLNTWFSYVGDSGTCNE